MKLKKSMKKKKKRAIRKGLYKRLEEIIESSENPSKYLENIKQFLSHVSPYKDLGVNFIYKGENEYDSYLFNIWGNKIKAAWDSGIDVDVENVPKLKLINENFLVIVNLFKDNTQFRNMYDDFFHDNKENEYFNYES